jgi:hypothetical protein
MMCGGLPKKTFAGAGCIDKRLSKGGAVHLTAQEDAEKRIDPWTIRAERLR